MDVYEKTSEVTFSKDPFYTSRLLITSNVGSTNSYDRWCLKIEGGVCAREKYRLSPKGLFLDDRRFRCFFLFLVRIRVAEVCFRAKCQQPSESRLSFFQEYIWHGGWHSILRRRRAF